MAGGGGQTVKGGLETTPTWIVALVCFVIILISIFAERCLHYLGKKWKKQNRKALHESLLKVKEELMLLGFIAFMLTVFQGFISNICIPENMKNTMLPCKSDIQDNNATIHYQVFQKDIAYMIGGKRRLLAAESADKCADKGKVQLLSLSAIHELHIFIFVLAVTHVIFTATTIILGSLKMRQWKRLEDSIRTENDNEGGKPFHRTSIVKNMIITQARPFKLLYHKVSRSRQLVLQIRNFGVAALALDVPQRSTEWFELRKNKLTTSSFSTALGFWKKRRSELWYEKVFSLDSSNLSSNSAMTWGVLNEAAAIERYKTITCHEVDLLGFATHADEEKFGWMGGSPDGLVCEMGILEVKCPYNKGKPELGMPWTQVPYYYLPQIQGLMEIMGREWVDLYCWTPKASTVFRVLKDARYWELIHGILREFWWESVVPAKEALLIGDKEGAERCIPSEKHLLTGYVIAQSKILAAEARIICKEIEGKLEIYPT